MPLPFSFLAPQYLTHQIHRRSGFRWNEVAISSINLAEIVYVVKKKRLPASAHHDLRIAMSDPDFVMDQILFTAEIVNSMRHVPPDQMPDARPHDRRNRP